MCKLNVKRKKNVLVFILISLNLLPTSSCDIFCRNNHYCVWKKNKCFDGTSAFFPAFAPSWRRLYFFHNAVLWWKRESVKKTCTYCCKYSWIVLVYNVQIKETLGYLYFSTAVGWMKSRLLLKSAAVPHYSVLLIGRKKMCYYPVFFGYRTLTCLPCCWYARHSLCLGYNFRPDHGLVVEFYIQSILWTCLFQIHNGKFYCNSCLYIGKVIYCNNTDTVCIILCIVLVYESVWSVWVDILLPSPLFWWFVPMLKKEKKKSISSL